MGRGPTPNSSLSECRYNVWHAGHVNDAVVLNTGDRLLATETGGVWLAFAGGETPVPLSDRWVQVDMKCLSLGSKGPHHAYAGGSGGALYETKTESLLSVSRFLRLNSVRGMAATLQLQPPISVQQILRSTGAALFDWAPVALVDRDGKSIGSPDIHQIVVVAGLQPAKIVLATDQGVFWSDIPRDGHSYGFVAAIAGSGNPLRPRACHKQLRLGRGNRRRRAP